MEINLILVSILGKETLNGSTVNERGEYFKDGDLGIKALILEMRKQVKSRSPVNRIQASW